MPSNSQTDVGVPRRGSRGYYSGNMTPGMTQVKPAQLREEPHGPRGRCPANLDASPVKGSWRPLPGIHPGQ